MTLQERLTGGRRIGQATGGVIRTAQRKSVLQQGCGGQVWEVERTRGGNIRGARNPHGSEERI